MGKKCTSSALECSDAKPNNNPKEKKHKSKLLNRKKKMQKKGTIWKKWKQLAPTKVLLKPLLAC